jgi:methylmalonyl-CoA/ethylmalonyl-CoA epimerase
MQQSKIFRQLHHVCVIVRELEAAVAFYESVGIGPWHDYPSLEQYQLEVKDRKGYLNLRYRYANLDNFQLQLCQPGEGDTPQRRFLEERGEGVFHLGFAVPDLDAGEKEGLELGFGIISRGRLPDHTGFTYFDTAQRGAGVTLEIRNSSLC